MTDYQTIDRSWSTHGSSFVVKRDLKQNNTIFNTCVFLFEYITISSLSWQGKEKNNDND